MKAVGLILVFVSVVATGFMRANSYKESEKEIRGFIELLYFIKHEITFYLTPQSKIYEKFRHPALENNGFLPMLRRLSSQGTELPLFCSITECAELKCGNEVRLAVKDFAETFGTLSTAEQCERCDRAVAVLEEIYKKKKEETLEKTRLCRSVGCMIGLGLVLLLW